MEDDIETAVGIAGDWHGSAWWIGRAIPSLRRANPHIRTILHLGDFWADQKTLDTVDYWARLVGITRVLVTSGNHEPWPTLTRALEAAGGQPARLSDTIYALPRPYRFEISGRTFLSLGGAASVRPEPAHWSPDEAITDAMVAEAIAGGPADIMLTHESPETTPVTAVRNILDRNPERFSSLELAVSAASRHQIQRVWDAVRPEILLHGHMHTAGAGTTADGRRVISLGADNQHANIAELDLATLELTTVDVRARRQ